MNRLNTITQKVRDLYEAKNDARDEWADWLYAHHVFVVADYAKEIAAAKGVDAELSQVAAMLHDIADVVMARVQEGHEAKSLEIGRELMKESGFSDEEIALVVDDAVALHSCHDGICPKSKEGLVLATADALAHLDTGFYVYATWARGKRGDELADIQAWVLKKIERDFHTKIAFDDIREEQRHNYEAIKALFSR